MNIGILGSGDVAKALGHGFLKHGHPVMMGTRKPSKLDAWTAEHQEASAGSFADAANFGEAIVLAVKGDAAATVLDLAGSANIAGKTVMDATNPLAAAPPDNGVLHFFTTLEDSLMERLQAAHPDGRFVKVFNSVGSHLMVNPQYAGGVPTMFICGNDASAKHLVSEILTEFGWEPLDMGGAEGARAIEPLCILWCIPGFLRGEWTHAFRVLHA